jgi:hypothetical protein
MANKSYRLLEQGITAGWDKAEGLEPDAEIELELDDDSERAFVAAGWIEPLEDKTAAKKGGK